MVESLNVPVATNPISVVGATVRPVGVTELDWINAFVTLSVTDALTKPSAAMIVVEPAGDSFCDRTVTGIWWPLPESRRSRLRFR